MIWSWPVWSLAGEWGISDVGLAKICKRNNIPRPGLGYWARVQAGYKVKQTPLPKEDYVGCIEISGHHSDGDASSQRTSSFKPSKPLRRQLRSVVISKPLTERHLSGFVPEHCTSKNVKNNVKLQLKIDNQAW